VDSCAAEAAAKLGIFFVHPNGRRSASEDDREYLLRSLRGYTDVIDIEVDPLVDAWYPPDP